jgi:4-phosphopantoate--beta-alanine ligase
MRVNPSHPRYASLVIREKLVDGLKKGITSQAGLLAHGRGETFDYLLGEKTNHFAIKAIKAAAACLLLAKTPIISINGNSAALAGKEFVTLAKLINSKVEVNLFHRSEKRVKLIENYLSKFDRKFILQSTYKNRTFIPNIQSPRSIVLNNGIKKADTVFVPLEDGDRCEVLSKLGKKVIAVDLNPLSRTARNAYITIVDNLTRAMPVLIEEISYLKSKKPYYMNKLLDKYDNKKNLNSAYDKMIQNIKQVL